MTALLYYLTPEKICVAMDTCTLRIEPDGNLAYGPFCSKIFALPHMRLALCGTGIRELIFHWHAFLQQNVVARDIEELDSVARAQLPEIASHYQLAEKRTSTIYHFGFSRLSGGASGFAYRSIDGFKGERLVFGLGVKPSDQIDLAGAYTTCDTQGLTAGFVEVMKLQKAVDDSKPMNERVGIGGEVQFLHLTATDFNIHTAHRFDDFDDRYTALRSACSSPV